MEVVFCLVALLLEEWMIYELMHDMTFTLHGSNQIAAWKIRWLLQVDSFSIFSRTGLIDLVSNSPYICFLFVAVEI